MHTAFSSGLGGAAWTALTRADMAIHIQALQRRGAGPRVVDLKRLNVVLRYLKRHQVGIFYGKVPEPYRLTGYTDAAFKAQEDEGSGLAIRGLAVVLTTQSIEKPTSATCQVNLVEYLVRRIRCVVRSTFAAELNSLLDSIESVLLIQLAMH